MADIVRYTLLSSQANVMFKRVNPSAMNDVYSAKGQEGRDVSFLESSGDCSNLLINWFYIHLNQQMTRQHV